MTNPEINRQPSHHSTVHGNKNGHTSRMPEKIQALPILRGELHIGEWALQAACTGEDIEIFFPELTRHEQTFREQIKEAKAICADCPVQEECLDYALENHEDMLGGIFGGLTYKERSRLARRSNRQHPRTA